MIPSFQTVGSSRSLVSAASALVLIAVLAWGPAAAQEARPQQEATQASGQADQTLEWAQNLARIRPDAAFGALAQEFGRMRGHMIQGAELALPVAVLYGTGDRPSIGKRDADRTRTVVVFEAAGCKSCRDLSESLAADGTFKVVPVMVPGLASEPGENGQVRLRPDPAPRALAAAQEQGRWSEMRKELLALEQAPGDREIMALGAKIGLDPDRFKAALESGKVHGDTATALLVAHSMGFRTLPAAVVNGRVVGEASVEAIKEAASR
jgi:protein-disulfide isomerase